MFCVYCEASGYNRARKLPCRSSLSRQIRDRNVGGDFPVAVAQDSDPGIAKENNSAKATPATAQQQNKQDHGGRVEIQNCAAFDRLLFDSEPRRQWDPSPLHATIEQLILH
jgi:hypothetical protein